MEIDESEYDFVELDEVPSQMPRLAAPREVNLVLKGGGSVTITYVGAL